MDAFVENIFIIFSPNLLGLLSLVVAGIHIYKYYCKDEAWCLEKRHRPVYLVRALNWFVFGAAFLVFPHVDVLCGRAILRLALAFMVLSELSYNITFAYDMLKDVVKWTRNLLHL